MMTRETEEGLIKKIEELEDEIETLEERLSWQEDSEYQIEKLKEDMLDVLRDTKTILEKVLPNIKDDYLLSSETKDLIYKISQNL